MNNGVQRSQLINRDEQKRKKQPISLERDAKGIILRFNENIKNIQSRFKLVQVLIKNKLEQEAEDLLRFQIVYLMSALDFYMHELYSYGLLKVFNKQNEKSYQYREYKVPLKMVELALFDGENIEVHLKNLFISQNSSFTFMHPNRIKEMLNTISFKNAFDDVERILQSRSILKQHEQLENVIEKIYQRRNKISHQTDINHGKENKNTINQTEVINYSRVIQAMVEEIHQIVCQA